MECFAVNVKENVHVLHDGRAEHVDARGSSRVFHTDRELALAAVAAADTTTTTIAADALATLTFSVVDTAAATAAVVGDLSAPAIQDFDAVAETDEVIQDFLNNVLIADVVVVVVVNVVVVAAAVSVLWAIDLGQRIVLVLGLLGRLNHGLQRNPDLYSVVVHAEDGVHPFDALAVHQELALGPRSAAEALAQRLDRLQGQQYGRVARVEQDNGRQLVAEQIAVALSAPKVSGRQMFRRVVVLAQLHRAVIAMVSVWVAVLGGGCVLVTLRSLRGQLALRNPAGAAVPPDSAVSALAGTTGARPAWSARTSWPDLTPRADLSAAAGSETNRRKANDERRQLAVLGRQKWRSLQLTSKLGGVETSPDNGSIVGIACT